jgi:hypothetical protein
VHASVQYTDELGSMLLSIRTTPLLGVPLHGPLACSQKIAVLV